MYNDSAQDPKFCFQDQVAQRISTDGKFNSRSQSAIPWYLEELLGDDRELSWELFYPKTNKNYSIDGLSMSDFMPDENL